MNRRVFLLSFTLVSCVTPEPTSKPAPATHRASPTPEAVIAPPQPSQIDPTVTEARRLTLRIRELYPASQYEPTKIELAAISEWFTQQIPRYAHPPPAPLSEYKVALILQELLPIGAATALLQSNAVRAYHTSTSPQTIRTTKNQALVALNQLDELLKELP